MTGKKQQIKSYKHCYYWVFRDTKEGGISFAQDTSLSTTVPRCFPVQHGVTLGDHLIIK